MRSRSRRRRPRRRTPPGRRGRRRCGRPRTSRASAQRSDGTAKWFTLQGGALSEVYYPTLGTPSVRDLELVVSDGRAFTDRQRGATRKRVRLLSGRGLAYRQVNTARSGRYVRRCR